MTDRRQIAIAPLSRPAMFDAYVRAVTAAGGRPTPLEEASALMWADPAAVKDFPDMVDRAKNVEWVQLPYAGVEKFAANLTPDLTWTCGKGVYAEPVAEYVMAGLLAAFRHFHEYIGAGTWRPQRGRNLLGASVTVIGGGGIAEALIELLRPWRTRVTVLRRRDVEVPGAAATHTMDHLHEVIADTDAVVLAAALTAETRDLVDASFLESMAERAWLVNVARGGLVVTDDLVDALTSGGIAGAVLDVTEPEPLPDGHLLYAQPNCIITPHVGNTPEMGLPLIAERVRRNVERWIAGEPLIGLVDVEEGY